MVCWLAPANNYIGVGGGVLGGLEPTQFFFWRGQSPLNILGLILRWLFNYKLLPKVLKGYVSPPNIYIALPWI